MEKSMVRAMPLMMLFLVILAVAPATASLLPDNAVDVTLTAGATTIFDGVFDPGGPGFAVDVTVGNVVYRLTVGGDSFSLSLDCLLQGAACNLSSGLTLELGGLDFTPPAVLTGLTNVNNDELIPVAGSPTFTPSSLRIEFQGFTLDSSGYDATFVTEAIPSVPLPATLVLLFAGLGVAAALCRRSRA